MNNSFQTSFIPKKPVGDVIKRDHKIDLFNIISILILILAIIGSLVLYVYKIYLVKQKEALIISLDKSRNSFEEDTIKKLESFSKRTSAVSDILSRHKILSPLFDTLEEITIPNVQYIKFDHKINENGLIVGIDGIAKDYKAIAQQSEIFNSSKGRFFKNVVFSDLNKNNMDNTIKFKLEFLIDPSLLSYEKNLLIEDEGVIQN